MKRGYADTANGQIHYRCSGTGKPIIFLHNASGHSQEYEEVGNLLGKMFAVYAIDLPGHGASPRPEKEYTLMNHAASVISFMDTLGIQKAVIFGAIAGANIAAHLAAKWPERVIAVVLAQLVFSDESNRPGKGYSPVALQYDGSHLMSYWNRICRSNSQRINHIQVAGYCHAGDFGEGLCNAAQNDYGIADLLLQIKSPVLVLKYAACEAADLQDVVAGLISDAKLEQLEGALPCVAMDNPKQVADIIIKHFA